jgi:prolyl oligopeptidase
MFPNIAITAAFAATLIAVPASAQQPAPALAAIDTMHGVPIADAQRWLEDLTSPRVRDWIRYHDDDARRHIAVVQSRQATRAALATISRVDSYGAPVKRAGRYFITTFPSVGPNRGVSLLVQDSATGRTRKLIDAAASRAGEIAARRTWPSPDGQLVAYAGATDATEWETVRIRDVDSGRSHGDSVAGLFRYSALSWARGNVPRGYYYTRFEIPSGGTQAGRPATSGRIFFHRVGDSQARDRLVFAPGDKGIVTPTPQVTDDGRYLVITVRRGTARASRLYVQDLADQTRPPRPLIEEDGANYVFLGNDGPVFWVVTDSGAPRGRVIAIDASRPDAPRRRELVRESRDAIDTWSYGAAVGGNLIILYRRDAVLTAKVFDQDGKPRYEMPIPGRGSIWTGIVGTTTDNEAFFTVQGVADPGTIYRLDVRSGQVSPFLRPKLPYDPTRFVTEQVFYTARDGTRVPMYVVRRRDLPLDGAAPLWIYGYGAQRWAAAPWYQPAIAAWLEQGGVWALPNTRGGAEYGEDWFQAGSRLHKQTAIDDYVSAVEWLIANGYTTRGRVVAHTSSAGGALVAAAVVQRPELFGAAIMEYPVLDMLRYEHLLAGDRWSDDYGTVENANDFRAILGYAPIQNLRRGTCYPPTLVTPGEHDQTASPAHAYKFVAALKEAQGCDGHPVLLRVSWGAGHSAGATLEDAIDNWADQIAFVNSVLAPGRR